MLPPIVYEDEAMLVIDKPAGLPVALPRGVKARGVDTLAARLAAERGELTIVAHRIDAEISGLVVAAKDKAALDALSGEFQSKMAERVFHGLVVIPTDEEAAQLTQFPLARGPDGMLPETFEVDYALGPDLEVPGRVHVYRRRGGRPALTRVRVLERFRRVAWIEARPETSREKQVQVHLAVVGAPLLGDTVHGLPEVQLRLSDLKRGYKGREAERPMIDRLALHLSSLTLRHPRTREPVTFTSPLPKSFEVALRNLRKFTR